MKIYKWIISCNTKYNSLLSIRSELDNAGFTNIKVLNEIELIVAEGTEIDANDAYNNIKGITSIEKNGIVTAI